MPAYKQLIFHYCLFRVWDTRHAKVTMSLPIHNTKKLLYAVWVPSGNEILVTSASNVNTLIDVRKEAAVKSLPNEVEVCSTTPCIHRACMCTALTGDLHHKQ